jgi:hypothetical protein
MIDAGFLQECGRRERKLERLARRLDVPVEGMTREQQWVLAMGLQACRFRRGAARACRAHDAATAMVVVRALVELAINLRWVERDPTLNLEKWWAAEYKQLIATDRKWAIARAGLAGVLSEDDIAAMTAHRDDVKKRAGWSDQLFDRIDAGDDVAWQMYCVEYFALSSQAHSDSHAFRGFRSVMRADGTHIVPSSDWDPVLVRAWAVRTLAIVLESVSRVCGLGIDQACHALWNDPA